MSSTATIDIQTISPPLDCLNLAQWRSAVYQGGAPNWLDPQSIQSVIASCLIPHPENSRLSVDKDSFDALIESINDHGIEKPIVVCRTPELHDCEARILSGHRRMGAVLKIAESRGISLDNILVPIRIHAKVTLPLQEQIEIVLRENLNRKALAPLELATQIDNYMNASGTTAREASAHFGLRIDKINWHLNLLKLPDWIKEHITAGKLSASLAHDYILQTKIPEPKLKEIISEIVNNQLTNETARKLIIRHGQNELKGVTRSTSIPKKDIELDPALQALLTEETQISSHSHGDIEELTLPPARVSEVIQPALSNILDIKGGLNSLAERVLNFPLNYNLLVEFGVSPSNRSVEIALKRLSPDLQREYSPDASVALKDLIALWISNNATLQSTKSQSFSYRMMIQHNLDYHSLEPDSDRIYPATEIRTWIDSRIEEVRTQIDRPFAYINRAAQSDMKISNLIDPEYKLRGLAFDQDYWKSSGIDLKGATYTTFCTWLQQTLGNESLSRIDLSAPTIEISEFAQFLCSALQKIVASPTEPSGIPFLPVNETLTNSQKVGYAGLRTAQALSKLEQLSDLILSNL